MLTSVRHIAFLHTLGNRIEMSCSKCELKLEMEIKSFHFETELMEKDFGSRNDAFPPAVYVTCN